MRERPEPPSGIAWLLSQLGAQATDAFARRLGEVGLTPAHAGVLRNVGQSPGLSQQALAGALGVAASRVVVLVDELEARGLVERRRSADDRRNYELYLRADAAERLAQVRQIVRGHDADLTAPLTKAEKTQLLALLAKLAKPPRS